mmetsp:Transcript_87452/g.138901  ORF Transcript_87452/g.138901 Transcript_87452/m.138901 type:complete len:324 (-) Transcript_87452:160-1131(-)
MAPKKAAPEPVEEDVKEEPPPEIHQGDFVFPDGSTYSGQYMKKGESISMHGDGLMQSGPETFEGSFDNGAYKMGRYSSCSGAVYTGNYRNNKFHGVGDYRWPDGREYRGTWKDGYMHGYGMYLYFSVGADKRFMGFSMNGKFASGAVEQEEAKRAFLQEYGMQCVQSAAAALREMSEKATADGVPSDFLVPKDPEAQAERSATEDFVAGPFPEATAATQAGLQAFTAKLFAEEQPLQVSLYTGLSDKKLLLPFNEVSTFACLGTEETHMDKQRLKRQQLQVAGQAIEFFTEAEAGSLRLLVLVNVGSEFDWEAAKWKLVHSES